MSPDTEGAPVDLVACGARDCVARAADLRLIGLLFERPTPVNRRQVEELGHEAPDESLRALAARLRGFDEGTHVVLFGPGGPVSPREAAYIGRRDPGRVMSELAGFYEAFGFRAPADEPVDHVGTEVAFASYLSLKEAFALARGDAAAAEITAAALHRFFREHLAVLAGGLVARFATSPDPDLLTLAQGLLTRAGGVPLKEEDLSSVEEEDILSCGMCEDDGTKQA